MIPGEIIVNNDEIEINVGRATRCIKIINKGDRPVQVGSHFHFFEVNKSLTFSREEAYGFRLNIASGTSVRFEPGESKSVELVELGGYKRVIGLNSLTTGTIDENKKQEAVKNAKIKGFE